MTLVAVSYCFPPGRYAQSPQVARFVGMAADDAVVHAGDENGDPSLLATVAPTTTVHRHGWGPVATARRIARRVTLGERLIAPDANRPWADQVARTLLRGEPPDVVVTFGQPMADHLVGERLRRDRGVPWIAHLSDPWSGNPYRPLGRRSEAIQLRLQQRTLRQADAVVVTTDEQRDALLAADPSLPAASVSVIPHVFDAALYPAPMVDSDALVVRYVGAFYGPRTPAPLFAALRALADELEGVRVELVGGVQPSMLDDPVARSLPRGLLTARPPVDYVPSLGLIASADVLLVVDAPAAHSPFLPSKLVDYLGARRPIVALTPPGPTARVVSAAGGWVADPRDTAEAAAVLRSAIAAARADRTEPWGDDAVVSAHDLLTVRDDVRALVDRVRA